MYLYTTRPFDPGEYKEVEEIAEKVWNCARKRPRPSAKITRVIPLSRLKRAAVLSEGHSRGFYCHSPKNGLRSWRMKEMLPKVK